MNLFILRTGLKTKKLVKAVKPLFNQHPGIAEWSVDLEDIDNVLRIEARDDLRENDIVYLLKSCGIHAECLPD